MYYRIIRVCSPKANSTPTYTAAALATQVRGQEC